MPKKCPSIGLNWDPARSKEKHSKPNQDERKAGVAPNREAAVDCIDVALINGESDPRCFNSSPVHTELGRIALWNHDRASSLKQY